MPQQGSPGYIVPSWMLTRLIGFTPPGMDWGGDWEPIDLPSSPEVCRRSKALVPEALSLLRPSASPMGIIVDPVRQLLHLTLPPLKLISQRWIVHTTYRSVRMHWHFLNSPLGLYRVNEHMAPSSQPAFPETQLPTSHCGPWLSTGSVDQGDSVKEGAVHLPLFPIPFPVGRGWFYT